MAVTTVTTYTCDGCGLSIEEVSTVDLRLTIDGWQKVVFYSAVGGGILSTHLCCPVCAGKANNYLVNRVGTELDNIEV